MKNIYWMITIVYAACMFMISSIPREITEEISITNYTNYESIMFHIVEYFFFGYFLYKAIKTTKIKKKALITVLIGIMFAISDEIHQIFVPGRAGVAEDVIFDAIGIVLIIILFKSKVSINKIRIAVTT